MSLFLVSVFFLFASCSSADKVPPTPVIPTEFKTSADVSYRSVRVSCDIERNATSELKVVMTSPEYLKGLTFECIGDEIKATLGGLSYSVSPDDISPSSLVMTLSMVFNSMTRVEDLEAKRTDDGYEYKGNCKLGEFVVKQNKDFSFREITLGKDFKVDFK